MRESFPRHNLGIGRYRIPNRPRNSPVSAHLQGGDGEGFDEEMGEEDNDFEGLDGSDMVVDVPGPNVFAALGPDALNLMGLAAHQAPGGPPPPPPPPTLPPSLEAEPPGFHSFHEHPGYQYEGSQVMNAARFDSPQAESPAAPPPASTYAFSQASIASLGQPGPPRASSVNSGQATGASTATINPAQHGQHGHLDERTNDSELE